MILGVGSSKNLAAVTRTRRSRCRSGVGVVNTFVYGPDLNNVEAELRALQQAAAEKNCPANIAKAPGKPEPGMGPIH